MFVMALRIAGMVSTATGIMDIVMPVIVIVFTSVCMVVGVIVV